MAAVKQALIIAAGNGSRLKSRNGDRPKPLTPVCGVPILKRILKASARAGIESAVIVVGYEADQIIQAISSDRSIRIRIDWVKNPDWNLANGVSVLKAQSLIKDDFVLMMSDHLFQWRTLSRFLRRRPSPGEVLLAVDRKLGSIFDMEDATKVQLDGSRIVAIGKELEAFNAVDTGIFLCTPAIFPSLEALYRANGNCSLSEGMRGLIQQGKFRAFDIHDDWWQDVDTPQALAQAETQLLERLRRPTDGFVARHLNRPLSLLLTRYLAGTSITANHITWFSLVLGFISAVCFGIGSYLSVVLGAAIFQVIAVLDGCDGEMARLRMEESQEGGLWDTIADHLIYFMVLAGVMIGLYRLQGHSYVLIVGLFTVFDAALTLNTMHAHLRATGDWSLQTFYDAVFPRQGSITGTFLGLPIFDLLARFARAVIRPDFFALVTLVFALLGNLPWIFWSAFVATHVTALVVLYGQANLVGRLGEEARTLPGQF